MQAPHAWIVWGDPEESAPDLCTIEMYGVSQSILKYAPRLECLLTLSGRTGNSEGAGNREVLEKEEKKRHSPSRMQLACDLLIALHFWEWARKQVVVD
jgi:hypothetical protein